MSDSQVEERARAAGWKPLDKFGGDPKAWISAEQYMERVEHVLPAVRAERDRLRESLSTTNQRVSDLERQIGEARESMDAFTQYQTEETQRQVDAAKRNLKRELAQARKDGDTEAEIELEEAIDKLNEPKKVETKADTKPEQKVDPAFQAVLDQWRTDGNQWYGVDQAKTAYANGMAGYLNVTDPTLKGRNFLDKLSELVEHQFPSSNSARERPSKVEETRGGGSSKGSGKSYADLPQEAKAACDSFSSRVVGSNKVYKTEKDWRDKYARDHFAREDA